MTKARILIGIGFIIFMLMPCLKVDGQQTPIPRSYYFSSNGNDQNKGTLREPFKSLSKVVHLVLQNGDSILLKSGEVFEGPLKIENNNLKVVISSYGKGSATINGENNQAIVVSNSSQLKFQNLMLIGNGRKNGNTSNGCSISNSKNIQIDQVTISGFQKAGLYIFSSQHLSVNHCIAKHNGASGILVDGTDKKSSRYITIRNSEAIDNPGDPTNFTNHSGNGILVGWCTSVLIDHCEATNNGWDMPRIGNGPVGIWTYESDSVIIQNCVSHHNKTSNGGSDGGGFDLDGGVTNAIIQNCESYENEGAGYGIYQYAGASNWDNNKIINCSSLNDGLKSGGKAAVYIWNSSQDQKQFKNLVFKNNRIINRNNVAIKFDILSNHESFKFIGNTFTGRDSVLVFNQLNEKDLFQSNKWTSLTRGKLNNDEELHQNIIQPSRDLTGQKINAHGSGILYYNNYYYLYGEVKSGSTWLVPGQQWECYRVPAGGIACYRSTDLKNWTNLGVVLAPTTVNASSELDTSRVIERPKVIYNERTKKFVLWMHLDKNDYSYARVGVAVSDKPEGPFKLVNSFQPNGEESRDMTIFKDADGKAYLFNASENNNTMHVNELTDDYLQLKPNYTKILVNERRESPAVFSYQNKYYLITSLCTGWAPNKALYAVADHPMGPWKQIDNPCIGNDAEITYGSQISYIQPLKENGKFLVLADAWDRYDLKHSAYLWMQLYFDKTNPMIISSKTY
ncbi:MAG: family 43 glycosylhydrolase [Bacteroidetes bacterium]|nr:family 43 glycosylhydrolase [Bacteroidota bacterium]